MTLFTDWAALVYSFQHFFKTIMSKKTSDLFKLLFVLNRPKAILAGTTLTIKVEKFFCLVRMYFLKFYEFHFFVKKFASFCKFDVPKMLLFKKVPCPG